MNAGTYEVVFVPDRNHAWRDGSITPKKATYTISKAPSEISLEKDKTMIPYVGVSVLVNMDLVGDGAVTAHSSDTNVAEVHVDGALLIITSKGEGVCTVTVSMAGDENYEAAEDAALTVVVSD